MKNKFKIFLSFVLSLIISFSVTPTTAFASQQNIDTCSVIFSYGTLEKPTSFVTQSNKNLPYTFSNGSINSIGYVSINFDCNISCSKNDVINVVIPQSDTHYPDTFECSERATINAVTSDGEEIYLGEGQLKYVGSCFIYEDISVPCDCTITYITASFEPKKINYLEDWQGSYLCRFTIDSITVSVESETKSLGNKISKFFTNLFDKLTTGLDNIGSWFRDLKDGISSFFSSLTESIRTFFTNLGNNLKEWFSNVGQWFKEIGDKIGGFFTDLWNNITIKFEELGNRISDWWQSVVDFFRSLFVPEEGYFDRYKVDWEAFISQHFGLLYQSTEIIEHIFSFLCSFGSDSYSFTIPEIKLPFLNNPVIVPQTSFEFNSLISQHTQIKYVYNTFQIMVTFISFLGLVLFAKKTLEDIIGER